MYWRYQLTKEVQLRTIRSKRGKGNRLSINILELMAMVMTAYVVVAMRGDKPDREGATVLMLGDNSSAVQWVINCKRGRKEKVRAGALVRILGALETKGGCCFQAQHMRGVDSRLAEGITRWKGEMQINLTKESPQTVWQVQELGKEEQRMCSEILARGYTLKRVATSTSKSYEENWRMWVSWRRYAEQGIWSDPEMEEADRASAIHGVLLRGEAK